MAALEHRHRARRRHRTGAARRHHVRRQPALRPASRRRRRRRPSSSADDLEVPASRQVRCPSQQTAVRRLRSRRGAVRALVGTAERASTRLSADRGRRDHWRGRVDWTVRDGRRRRIGRCTDDSVSTSRPSAPAPSSATDCVIHARSARFASAPSSAIASSFTTASSSAARGSGSRSRRTARTSRFRRPPPSSIEDDVEIGANSTIDRPAVGETRIQAGTKIDNLVHIAHGVSVGRRVLLAAQVGISGSAVVEDDVILAGQVGVAGHLRIGKGAMATAQSGIPDSLEPGEYVSGSPAIPHRDWLKSAAAYRALPALRKRVAELEQPPRRTRGETRRMPDTPGSLKRRATRVARRSILVAAMLVAGPAIAGAQQPGPQPLEGPDPSFGFMSRYDFQLEANVLSGDDGRQFRWDTHFGGEFDLFNYVKGRATVVTDYEAVLGSEFRPFDPNQGIYILEPAGSWFVGRNEVSFVFHHVSRHLERSAEDVRHRLQRCLGAIPAKVRVRRRHELWPSARAPGRSRSIRRSTTRGRSTGTSWRGVR